MSSSAQITEPGSYGARPNYFIRHWRGDLSLSVSYWINGLLASLSVYGIALAMAYLIFRMHTDYSPAIYWVAIWFVIFLITLWQTVGIWRSAGNSQTRYGKRSNGRLAKFMVILGIISTCSQFLNQGLPAITDSLKYAALEKWTMKVVRNGTELELSGGIGNGFTKDLSHVLEVSSGIKLVHLDLANGGLISEAHSAGALIGSRNLDTYVSSYCQSACTIVFLGGHQRFLGKNARLGFHSPSIPGFMDVSPLIANERRYLTDLGLSSGFIDHVFATPKSKMWYPDNEQLLKERVITSVVSGDEFALSLDSSRLSQNDLEGSFLKIRIYRVIKDKEPAIYQKIVKTLQDGIREGKAVDDMRPVTVGFIVDLEKKYLAYADETSLEHLANVIIAEINDLAAAPEPVCFKYLGLGQDVNEATRFFSKATAGAEQDAIADLIETGDLTRPMPVEAQKKEALKLLLSGLDKATLMDISAVGKSGQIGSYKTCLAVKATYLRLLAMPEPYKEIALRTLLDRG